MDIEVKTGSLDTMQVHNQWASRVPEEKWLSLYDFHQFNTDVYHASQTKVYSLKELKAIPCSKDETGKALSIVGPSGKEAGMTNWSFNQLLGQRLKGYPSMVSRMPSKLASEVMNWHIEEAGDEKIGVLLQRKAGDNVLMRAVTSEGYGRIWNYQITRPMVERFGDGVTGDWVIPGIRGKSLETITKSNTTIYGSDRDMHIMLADEANRIVIPNRRNGKEGSLARGFIVANSETGGGKLYLAFFTYDFLCENRIIWGLDDSFEISIKHSKNAPERWLEEIAPAIENYGKSKASRFEERLLLAQGTSLNIGKDSGGMEKAVISALSHSFPSNLITKKMVSGVIEAHKNEEGRPIESVWDMVTAITASAKGFEFSNERIPMERAGGKLLELVAN